MSRVRISSSAPTPPVKLDHSCDLWGQWGHGFFPPQLGLRMSRIRKIAIAAFVLLLAGALLVPRGGPEDGALTPSARARRAPSRRAGPPAPGRFPVDEPRDRPGRRGGAGRAAPGRPGRPGDAGRAARPLRRARRAALLPRRRLDRPRPGRGAGTAGHRGPRRVRPRHRRPRDDRRPRRPRRAPAYGGPVPGRARRGRASGAHRRRPFGGEGLAAPARDPGHAAPRGVPRGPPRGPRRRERPTRAATDAGPGPRPAPTTRAAASSSRGGRWRRRAAPTGADRRRCR